MSDFFEFLAATKQADDTAFRTASAQVAREASEQFGSFVVAYGEQASALLEDQVHALAIRVAAQHNIEDKIDSLTKTAWMGLGSPLLKERKNWTQEDWNRHYDELGAQRSPHTPPANPNALVRHPELDGLDPTQPVPAHIQEQIRQKSAKGESSPTMDKRKWTPRNVRPLKTDDPKGPHPTKTIDITEPVELKNGDSRPVEIGEQVTERYDLGKDKQKSSGSDKLSSADSVSDQLS